MTYKFAENPESWQSRAVSEKLTVDLLLCIHSPSKVLNYKFHALFTKIYFYLVINRSYLVKSKKFIKYKLSKFHTLISKALTLVVFWVQKRVLAEKLQKMNVNFLYF